MTENFKMLYAALKTAFKNWWSKDPFKESAVIAYYAIFSLPGLLVVILTLAGYFFGHDAVNGQLSKQFTSTMGAETALQIQDIIAKGTQSKDSFWATVLGIVTILLGSTGVFVQFQKSLNDIWEVKVDVKKSGIWDVIKVRIFSFGLLIAILFILTVSLVISATITAFGNWIINYFSASLLIFMQFLNFALSLGVLAILFASMFKLFPDAKIKWSHVWVGALLTAILFEIGKFTLGFYFGTAEPSASYGAAGSIILILLWVSYSSMIVFYGAEFTHAYAKLKDGRVIPGEHAVKVKVTKD
ncbi:MAG: YihY/virulence factor BrkB family protein [Saprospiraceae bacterium]|nr:YihY/virulence factor BrkB family protein [Saprospiraceae bacterium]MBK7812579.1 YihY/virulence factor BrkB family protein [Saprospiraceae bacterium]MBK9630770.1 YihY/virulence factor BrkB family protein [Saprospiraceae bacterium]